MKWFNQAQVEDTPILHYIEKYILRKNKDTPTLSRKSGQLHLQSWSGENLNHAVGG